MPQPTSLPYGPEDTVLQLFTFLFILPQFVELPSDGNEQKRGF
jgi:hypothetical protein